MRPGYKKTEVGLIPDDWDVPNLRNCLKHDATYGVVTAGAFQRDGVAMLRGGDIKDGAIGEDQPFITKEKSAEYSRTVLHEGDVVIALVGYPGESSVIPERLIGANISRAVGLLRPNAKIIPAYLSCYLNSPSGRKDFLRPSAGSAQIVVNLSALNKLPIPVPQLPEQTAIATTLSDVDALLAGLDKLIAKKRNLKQAAMQQLLTGKTRLPGFTDEWEVKRLEELASIRSGGTPSTGIARFWDGDIPWCTPTDITQLSGKKYLASTDRKITSEGLTNSSAELIPASSVVMTSRATIGECAVNSVPVATNQGFKNFVPFETTDGEFLYYLLQTQTQGFIRLCAGSTFLEIGKTQLSAYEVRIPVTKGEQVAISTILSKMDIELEKLERRREKTRLLKQGMMQELLTGRTRLVQPAAQPASNVVPFPQPEATSAKRKANVHFQRSVFAAEIVERLHTEPTFGHVKFQKLIYLAEHLCKVDIGAHYHRDAAGPYDNRALRSIDSQMEKNKWFQAKKLDKRYQYVPLAKHGDHKPYFDRYFANVSATFDKVIDTFKTATSEQCEIVATLYEAWRDLLAKNGTATDDAIIDQVLNHWHEAKRRIDEDRWRTALAWMRANSFAPEGAVQR